MDGKQCASTKNANRLEVVGPKSQWVPPGSAFTLECEAFGVPQAHVRWEKEGVEVDQGGAKIGGDLEERKANMGPGSTINQTISTGTTLARLTVPCADEESAGSYACVAENRCGEVVRKEAIIRVDNGGEEFSF